MLTCSFHVIKVSATDKALIDRKLVFLRSTRDTSMQPKVVLQTEADFSMNQKHPCNQTFMLNVLINVGEIQFNTIKIFFIALIV